MRGKPIDLPPMTLGLQANVPPHLVRPGALIDGSNVFTDIDGQTRPRFGYAPLLTPGPSIGAINGIFSWIDLDNSNQYLAVSPTDAATVKNGAWTTITGTPGLIGSYTDPVRFATFFQNNLFNILISNNHDAIKLWSVAQATLQPLTPTVALSGLNSYSGTVVGGLSSYPVNTQFFFTVANANTGVVTINLNGLGAKPARKLSSGAVVEFVASDLKVGTTYNFSYDGTEFLLGTNLLAPVAKDITVVGDRVVAANILNGGVRNFTQVAWTAAFDMTLWPALAFYNLSDIQEDVHAVRQFGNSAAIVYGTESGVLMQTIPGAADAFAFSFSPIRGMTMGPVSPSAVVVAEGLHYYVGNDARVWATDGNSAWSISAAIDPVVLKDLNASTDSQIFGDYYHKTRQIWWWYQPK